MKKPDHPTQHEEDESDISDDPTLSALNNELNSVLNVTDNRLVIFLVSLAAVVYLLDYFRLPGAVMFVGAVLGIAGIAYTIFSVASPEIKSALERFVAWEKAGYFNEGYNVIDEGDVHREFSKGNMLMYYYSAMSENSNLQADNPGFEIGFFNFPAVTPGTPLLNMSNGGNVFFIPTTAAHPEETIDLLNWLLTREPAEMMAAKGIVSTHNLDLSNVTKPIAWMDEELEGLKKQMPLNWINWSVPGLGDVTGPEVQRVLAGEITVDEALKSFQEAYDKGCNP